MEHETTSDDAHTRDRIRAMVDAFPPLTPEQIARLRRIIGYSDPPNDEGDHDADTTQSE